MTFYNCISLMNLFSFISIAKNNLILTVRLMNVCIEEKSNIRVVGSFPSFTYWNYDKVPGETDNYRQAVQWIKVAEALHESD